jgi:hypothetical protein
MSVLSIVLKHNQVRMYLAEGNTKVLLIREKWKNWAFGLNEQMNPTCHNSTCYLGPRFQ